MRVLIIIPAYNEESNIVGVIESLNKANTNIDYVVIDDCSKDLTLKVCKENDINVISLPINLGIGGGVQTGYRYAFENNYDIAIQIDGDGQHDPVYIPNLIKPILDNEADFVIGSRFISKDGFQSSAQRRVGIGLLSFLINLTSGIKIKDVTSGYRAVNRSLIKAFAVNYAQDFPEPEAIVYAQLSGYRIKEIPVIMKERQSGTSSIGFVKAIYYMIKVSIAILISRMTFSLESKHE